MKPLATFAPFALALVCACARAPEREHHWSPNAPRSEENFHPSVMLVMRHDANGDGIVTRRELEAGLRQDFRQLDTNGDGRLDADEVEAANRRRIAADQSMAIPLIDWNEDGYVDFDEFADGVRSLFEQLDQNSDGQVTPDELRAAGYKIVPAKSAKPP